MLLHHLVSYLSILIYYMFNVRAPTIYFQIIDFVALLNCFQQTYIFHLIWIRIIFSFFKEKLESKIWNCLKSF